MATPDERAKHHQRVLEHLEELASVDIESLARREELGQLHLGPAVEHIQTLLQFVRQLEGRDLTRLPAPTLQKTAQALGVVRDRIDELKNFTLEQANPTQARANLLQQVENSYDNVLEPLLVPLAYTATQAADLARIEREALEHRDRLSEKLRDTKKDVEGILKEAQRSLTAIKETAGEAGVAEEANHFRRAREHFETAATKWMKATIASAIATLVVSIIFLVVPVFGLYVPSGVPESIQYTMSKVIVLSVLSFAVLWSARNYRSSRHNEVLSKHREDALGTFRAFVEATDDPLVKDAILLQAATAAFGGRATGFDPNEPEPSGTSPLIDVFGRNLPSASSDLSKGAE